MTELRLSVPSWLLAIGSVIWTVHVIVSWRLAYWTKRAAQEKARIKKETIKAQMDKAFGR